MCSLNLFTAKRFTTGKMSVTSRTLSRHNTLNNWMISIVTASVVSSSMEMSSTDSINVTVVGSRSVLFFRRSMLALLSVLVVVVVVMLLVVVVVPVVLVAAVLYMLLLLLLLLLVLLVLVLLLLLVVGLEAVKELPRLVPTTPPTTPTNVDPTPPRTPLLLATDCTPLKDRCSPVVPGRR